MSDQEDQSNPLSVGDVVRVDVASQAWLSSNSYSSGHLLPSTWQTPMNTPYPYSSPQYTYTNISTSQTITTAAAKQPPLGALLIITGLLRNAEYPMEAKDIESGEEFEVYRYQVSLDPFLTAVHRRRAAKEVEIESQIETSEPLLLEAAE